MHFRAFQHIVAAFCPNKIGTYSCMYGRCFTPLFDQLSGMHHTMKIQTSSRFKILKFYPNITSETLIEEIAYRKVSFEIANRFLKQAFVLDRQNDKKSVCFAFPNANGGHTLEILNQRNSYSLTANAGAKTFTYLPGADDERIEVFANHWDLLTWLTMNRDSSPKFSCYVLNGFENVHRVAHILAQSHHGLKSIFDYLPNTPEGETTRQFIYDHVGKLPIKYGAQNYIYRRFKGLNQYWMNDEEAHALWPLNSERI